MAKITKANEQFRINIPQEIAKLKEWDENTELYFVPFLQGAESKLDRDTTIMLKEGKSKKNSKVIR